MRPGSTCRLTVGVLVTLFVAAPARAERKELRIALDLPPARALGSYTGSVRMALGEVRDATFSETPSHLGMGPQAAYEVTIEGSREEAVRAGVLDALQKTGLLASSASDASVVVDVVLRRSQLMVHQTFFRFRLRSEVFLELEFKLGESVAGRALACGNAETYAQVASKAKLTETYQLGFNDALHKLLESTTFARLAGEGWSPASAPERGGKHDTTRIHKDEFYGPTDLATGLAATRAAGFAKALAGKLPIGRLVLADFAVEQVKGKDAEMSDPEFAKAFVPERIREHLNAFYPGAFASIERGDGGGPEEGLRVSGALQKFIIGSLAKRIFVGFGAGKDKLEGDVVFEDAAAGSSVLSVHVLDSNWGAGWQTKQGQIRDMADQLARDIAFLLVTLGVPEYRPPADLEVLFDDTPYPMRQRKQ